MAALRSWSLSDFRLEDVEGHRPILEDLGMKLERVEARTQSRLSPIAQRPYLKFTHLTGQGIRGLSREAVDHEIDLSCVRGQLRAKVVGRLLARPVHGMQARVDDQCSRTPQLADEDASPGFILASHTQFLAQGRRIERPAVHKGRIGAEPPKLGQVGPRLLHRGLIVASRYGLLHETWSFDPRPSHSEGRGVYVENRRPSAR